jgi:pseudouridine-5'-phosphate glycosidase
MIFDDFFFIYNLHFPPTFSADLTELGRTPVGVVCAGVKSILDIALTLEYLETQGVPVATLPGPAPGPAVPEFPAFFTRASGCKAPLALTSPAVYILLFF